MKRIFLLFICSLVLISCTKTPPSDQVFWGLKKESIPKNLLKAHPHILGWTVYWEQDFPVADVRAVLKKQAIPFITWQPFLSFEKEAVRQADILDSIWDGYIREWAQQAKSVEFPVFVSLAPLVNHEEGHWSLNADAASGAHYKDAVQAIINIVKEEGAHNIIWVWEIAVESYPDRPWNEAVLAYPGDEYVDWIGLVGRNFGKSESWSVPRTADQVFSASIKKISQIIPQKVVMISGMSTAGSASEVSDWMSEIPDLLNGAWVPVRAILLEYDTQTPFDLELFKHDRFDADIDTIQTIKPYVAPATPNVTLREKTYPIEIDGMINEWKKKSLVVAESALQLKATWDQSSLYIAAQITTDGPLKTWPRDLMTKGHAMVLEITEASGKSFKLTLSPQTKMARPSAWSLSGGHEMPTISLASKNTDQYYTLEFRVPWHSLNMEVGDASDFLLGITTIDPSGAKRHFPSRHSGYSIVLEAST